MSKSKKHTLADKITRHLGVPCSESLDWLRKQTGSPEQIWSRCQHGGWMFWLLEKANAAGLVDRDVYWKARDDVKSYTGSWMMCSCNACLNAPGLRRGVAKIIREHFPKPPRLPTPKGH